jgi:hypothetical protein
MSVVVHCVFSHTDLSQLAVTRGPLCSGYWRNSLFCGILQVILHGDDDLDCGLVCYLVGGYQCFGGACILYSFTEYPECRRPQCKTISLLVLQFIIGFCPVECFYFLSPFRFTSCWISSAPTPAESLLHCRIRRNYSTNSSVKFTSVITGILL